jgi:hypothetical protein
VIGMNVCPGFLRTLVNKAEQSKRYMTKQAQGMCGKFYVQPNVNVLFSGEPR